MTLSFTKAFTSLPKMGQKIANTLFNHLWSRGRRNGVPARFFSAVSSSRCNSSTFWPLRAWSAILALTLFPMNCARDGQIRFRNSSIQPSGLGFAVDANSFRTMSGMFAPVCMVKGRGICCTAWVKMAARFADTVDTERGNAPPDICEPTGLTTGTKPDWTEGVRLATCRTTCCPGATCCKICCPGTTCPGMTCIAPVPTGRCCTTLCTTLACRRCNAVAVETIDTAAEASERASSPCSDCAGERRPGANDVVMGVPIMP
mmetsp:Transcript_94014/g.271764  ORF Transcript_94014/g.271764 Transcript_94014/m.271764 type:complete len:260 (-) Transcript_94014:217-996(-)